MIRTIGAVWLGGCSDIVGRVCNYNEARGAAGTSQAVGAEGTPDYCNGMASAVGRLRQIKL